MAFNILPLFIFVMFYKIMKKKNNGDKEMYVAALSMDYFNF